MSRYWSILVIYMMDNKLRYVVKSTLNLVGKKGNITPTRVGSKQDYPKSMGDGN